MNNAERIPDEPIYQEDPRWAYALTKDRAFAAWPCFTRRDEHAGQVK